MQYHCLFLCFKSEKWNSYILQEMSQSESQWLFIFLPSPYDTHISKWARS